MKKCNLNFKYIYLFLIIFVILIIFIYLFIFSKQKIKVINNQHIISPNYPYSNLPTDVLLNPYSPPLKDERFLIPQINYIPLNTIPINVSTNIGAVDTNYRQVGIITPINGSSKDNILSLMGRPVFNNRNLWQYYTISNQHNNVKLPLKIKNKDATNEYGVEKIYTNDVIQVDGINETYKVKIYENDTIKYLPFI
jgi:hypothetical protein